MRSSIIGAFKKFNLYNAKKFFKIVTNFIILHDAVD